MGKIKIKVMEKLELKHLAPYLPYGLKVVGFNNYINKDMVCDLTDRNLWTHIESQSKPLLRPLSSLTEEIEYNGKRFVPINFINGEFASKIPSKIEWNQSVKNQNLHFVLAEWISPEDLYGLFELLFKWHFDVFGLLGKGIAIDINTI